MNTLKQQYFVGVKIEEQFEKPDFEVKTFVARLNIMVDPISEPGRSGSLISRTMATILAFPGKQRFQLG
jgi:hypothetical protein